MTDLIEKKRLVFRNVIESLELPEGPERDYTLAGATVDVVVQGGAAKRVISSSVEAAIEKLVESFKGAVHRYDTCQTGYFVYENHPFSWMISLHDRETDERVKFKPFQFHRTSFKVTIYSATDIPASIQGE